MRQVWQYPNGTLTILASVVAIGAEQWNKSVVAIGAEQWNKQLLQQ
jgi:hypothetical protein